MQTRKLYIESYGCQMNVADSGIVASIMKQDGFSLVQKFQEADVIFINTCSIRAKAEQTVRHRLVHFNYLKKKKPDLRIGILGCMAERLKEKLLEEELLVDLVVGPDAYRDLPKLLRKVDRGTKAVNTLLSFEETYADISPIRLNANGVTAFISIMRGCDNMCSFCIVPFTRGRERSRDPHSIVQEAQTLFDQGYREITLLGQNVDSYKWSQHFGYTTKQKIERAGLTEVVNFSDLLEMVAAIDPKLRVRFSTSHPKDITDQVLHTIKNHDNICKYIHLPLQSGSSRVLKLMNRTYDRSWYLNRIQAIRRILGEECAISSDMITGFCSETEEEHQETLSLMDEVTYDLAYMFYYSERPGTLAARKYPDDIPLETKKRRLGEIIRKQQKHAIQRNQAMLGKTCEVLVEGYAKRNQGFMQGRTTHNKVVIFPEDKHQKGDYIMVSITSCTSGTLKGMAETSLNNTAAL